MSIVSQDTTGARTGADPARFATRPGASEHEAVTGPTPVVDLGDGHLQVSVRRGVTIVELDGGLDAGLAATIVGPLRRAVEGRGAVVVDLDRVTLLDPEALEAVCAVLDELPDDCSRCLVAGRLSGRMVLDRWGMLHRYVVFHSVADALQAREFSENGYGDGWTLRG